MCWDWNGRYKLILVNLPYQTKLHRIGSITDGFESGIEVLSRLEVVLSLLDIGNRDRGGRRPGGVNTERCLSTRNRNQLCSDVVVQYKSAINTCKQERVRINMETRDRDDATRQYEKGNATGARITPLPTRKIVTPLGSATRHRALLCLPALVVGAIGPLQRPNRSTVPDTANRDLGVVRR